MLKLNSKDEEELYRDWNGSYYEGSESADSENPQVDCLLSLEERIHLCPVIADRWQERLLASEQIMEKFRRKMKLFYGCSVGGVVFVLLLVLTVVLLEGDSVVVMVASGVILLVMSAVMILLAFGIKETCCYGIHSEWEIFQKYIRKYQVITLKSEIESLITGIRNMNEERQQAAAYKERLKKGEFLSEEEYQWALNRMLPPEFPVHTENLAENIGKRDWW